MRDADKVKGLVSALLIELGIHAKGGTCVELHLAPDGTVGSVKTTTTMKLKKD
jgi:hypothetical protein